MGKPRVSIERDLSLRRWEINVIGDGDDHLAQVFFYDDGRTEVVKFTREEVVGTLATDLYDAVKQSHTQAQE